MLQPIAGIIVESGSEEEDNKSWKMFWCRIWSQDNPVSDVSAQNNKTHW